MGYEAFFPKRLNFPWVQNTNGLLHVQIGCTTQWHSRDSISNQSYITGSDNTVKITELYKNIICNRYMPNTSQIFMNISFNNLEKQNKIGRITFQGHQVLRDKEIIFR